MGEGSPIGKEQFSWQIRQGGGGSAAFGGVWKEGIGDSVCEWGESLACARGSVQRRFRAATATEWVRNHF
jgi:hypothetical protein